MRLILHLALCLLLSAHANGEGMVSLSQDNRFFRMSNGVLNAKIEKSSGRIISAALHGQELLGSGSGYWSMSASSGESQVSGYGISKAQSVTIDPATNSGERAEVACHFHGNGADGSYPGTTEIRYSIDRRSNTLYATAIMSHSKGDAAFWLGEGRFVMKLDAGIFDQLTIDRDRNQIMPTGKDWEAGEPLNLMEARRMTTGIRKGMVEHKYAYSAMLGKVPAYGWAGTKRPYSVWMINPSVEYIAGGPTKMELTGHLDVGGEALPTLLNMWHGSHYGGTSLKLARDETWARVIGPFAIHFNQGGTPGDQLQAAYRQASAERETWPYPWVRHEQYPPASQRGGISGTLLIDEKRAVSPEDGELWVGLTVPEYESGDERTDGRICWQRDGRNYQYWVKAKPDGTFSLSGARPGTYVMRAFADGILGEFKLPDLTIHAGSVKPMGKIHWKPERAGPTLWEIGIPDRSSAEFRNGDRYWQWGNYLKFKSDFPKGVNYIVGKSDWKKDWHVCQPLDLSPDGKVMGGSTWRVRFPLERVPSGGARLRVAFCGSREGSHLGLRINGTSLGITMMPENGTMHRDSHRGMWFERSFEISAERLRPGENVLEFNLNGRVWHQGVLYDYIRMEVYE